MLSETIEKKIRAHAQEMTTSHAAITRARQGEIGPRSLANYLASLHFLFSQTVPHLQQAQSRARALGLNKLVPYFERKIAEERGHEKWAENDLDELSRRGAGNATAHPFPAVIQLVNYLTDLIDADPRLYVVYALCTEYFTVLAGPPWVQALTENCNVPGAALSAVTSHVEADRAHVAHALSEIDELISDPALDPVAAVTVDRTMQLLDEFFQEVVATQG